MERGAKYTFGSRDSTAVTVTKLRAALLRNRRSNPGSNKTLTSSLKHPNSSVPPPPLNFLLDTGGKLVGAHSWPLTPAQNRVNNGRIHNSTTPYAVTMSAETLILNTPLPTTNLSPFFYCLIIRDIGQWIRQPIYTTHTRQTLFLQNSLPLNTGVGCVPERVYTFQRRENLFSSRESNPGQPKHKLTRPTWMTARDLSLPAARWH